MQITFEVIWGAAVLIGMAITTTISIFTLREKLQTARQPHVQHMEQVADHERKLAADYERIERLEDQVNHLTDCVKELQALSKIQTRALQALLRHEIDGNDIHSLETEQEFIDRYLHPEKYGLAEVIP